MKNMFAILLALVVLAGCENESQTQGSGNSSTTTETIAGHTVTRMSTSDSEVVFVDFGEDRAIVYKEKKDDGGGGGGINTDCLVCKISNISTCAEEECPKVKEQFGPDASCRDQISECAERKCSTECTSKNGQIGVFGDFGAVRQ
jgi:hypothetical protein